MPYYYFEGRAIAQVAKPEIPMLDAVPQILEMNEVARLLRRHGYSHVDRGDSIIVRDPVHQSTGGGLLRIAEYRDVLIRSAAEARRFVAARS